MLSGVVILPRFHLFFYASAQQNTLHGALQNLEERKAPCCVFIVHCYVHAIAALLRSQRAAIPRAVGESKQTSRVASQLPSFAHTNVALRMALCVSTARNLRDVCALVNHASPAQ